MKLIKKPKAPFDVGQPVISLQAGHYSIRRRVADHANKVYDISSDEIGNKVTFPNLPGVEFFVHSSIITDKGGTYHGKRVTECRTGLYVGSDVTDTLAVSQARHRLNTFIQSKGLDALTRHIKSHKPVASLANGCPAQKANDEPTANVSKRLPKTGAKNALRIGSARPCAPAGDKVRLRQADSRGARNDEAAPRGIRIGNRKR